jgi:hypothetical protein
MATPAMLAPAPPLPVLQQKSLEATHDLLERRGGEARQGAAEALERLLEQEQARQRPVQPAGRGAEAARRRALADVSQLLRQDLTARRPERFAANEHLEPNEILQLSRALTPTAAAAPDERALAHLRRCPACRELLAASAPRPALFEELSARMAAPGSLAAAAASWEEGGGALVEAALALRGLGGLDAPALEGRPWAEGPFERGDVLAGGHRLEGVLGRGGAGVVYRAAAENQTQQTAAKVVLLDKFSPESLERLQDEGRRLAELGLRAILAPRTVAEHDGLPILLRDLADGPSLAAQSAGLPRDPGEAAEQVAALARTLQTVHEHGVLHLGLKPTNVFLATDGELVVSDFGASRLWSQPSGGLDWERLTAPAEELRYFLAYTAPEQFAAPERIGPAADVYGLGAVLYELLTGNPPCVAESPERTVRAVVEEPPRRPSAHGLNVPAALETICLRCLDKDPARRYPTASAAADDLSRFLHSWAEGQRQGWFRSVLRFLRLA